MLDSLKQKKNFQKIKMRIKTGDLVKVINGKEKGKTGEVLKTIPLENRVVVKGINLRTKHVKPTQEGETGRILTEEASLTVATITSPTCAYLLLEPKTLIHWSLLAPLLSATVKYVSC